MSSAGRGPLVRVGDIVVRRERDTRRDDALSHVLHAVQPSTESAIRNAKNDIDEHKGRATISAPCR
jgi:hypothetical protein